MKYQTHIDNFNQCNDQFLKKKEVTKTCGKSKCIADNKKERDAEYQRNRDKGKSGYKGLVLDTALPEVRMKNKFLLGLQC